MQVDLDKPSDTLFESPGITIGQRFIIMQEVGYTLK